MRIKDEKIEEIKEDCFRRTDIRENIRYSYPSELNESDMRLAIKDAGLIKTLIERFLPDLYPVALLNRFPSYIKFRLAIQPNGMGRRIALQLLNSGIKYFSETFLDFFSIVYYNSNTVILVYGINEIGIIMNDRSNIQFTIQPSSGIPIYKQIIEQVNRLVVSGFLKPGDQMPSVRQVAGDFEVNPMTISKAYSLLEATGVLQRVRGKGMIVAENRDGNQTLRKRMEMIQPVLREAVNQARQLNLPNEKVLKALRRLLEE